MTLPAHFMTGNTPYQYGAYAPYATVGARDVRDTTAVERIVGAVMRLSQPARLRLAGLVLAAIVMPMVPWQDDDAASTRLAALFNNEPIMLASQQTASPAPVTGPTASVTVAAEEPPAPVVVEKTLALATGQTLSGLLQSLNIVADDATAIAQELREVFDIRRLKAGQKFNLVLQKDGEKSQLVSMNFSANPAKEITLERHDDGSFDATAAAIPTSLKRLATAGAINGSLYESAADAGLPNAVMRDMMKMFAHAIDFQRDIHKGDKFQVMYDQRMTARGDSLGEGQIVYATIETGGKSVRMYRYEYEKGQYDYFDEQGRTAKRGLLRTPVDGARVTSGFGVRMHPVLGYSKMHEGIDFGAGAGTPIYAAGDGVIEQMGWNGSYGRFVMIRHNGTVETAYAHASGFAKGLSAGSRVKQGQVIAYVGSTGRATGAHLHYEIRMAGRRVNPMSVNIPTGRSLNKTEMVAFKRWTDQLQSEFKLASKGVSPITGPTKVAEIAK